MLSPNREGGPHCGPQGKSDFCVQELTGRVTIFSVSVCKTGSFNAELDRSMHSCGHSSPCFLSC